MNEEDQVNPGNEAEGPAQEFEPLVAPTEGVADESGEDFDEDDHL